jgi:hypothetical protein
MVEADVIARNARLEGEKNLCQRVVKDKGVQGRESVRQEEGSGRRPENCVFIVRKREPMTAESPV